MSLLKVEDHFPFRYEVGHYRNAGPNIWSDECFCSTSNVTQDWLGEKEGDSIYSYACNIEEPEGDLQAFDSESKALNLWGISILC